MRYKVIYGRTLGENLMDFNIYEMTFLLDLQNVIGTFSAPHLSEAILSIV